MVGHEIVRTVHEIVSQLSDPDACMGQLLSARENHNDNGDDHNNNKKKGVVDISCLHPEHIDEEKRCPIPVIVLQWKD